MIDKLFKLIVIVFALGFLLILIPLVIYLFVFQPVKIREPISNKYPMGSYVLVNKLSYKFGSPKSGDIIVFKSLKNLDLDEVGIIDKIDQEKITVENSPLLLRKFDIIGKVSFCYSSCK